MKIITTSWDDGDILDLRLVKLLDKYGIKGTFYISKNYRPNRLSENQIVDLSQKHEIGAHTLTHPDLRKLSENAELEETKGSKIWLESILNKEVSMFCYPAGFVGLNSENITRECLFIGARTTKLGKIGIADPFLMPTTLQVYPFPFRKKDQSHYYWRKLLQPIFERKNDLRTLGISYFSFYSWNALARATFDAAMSKEGVFHLWGHSWEIDRYDMWNELEKFFEYIGNRSDCKYMTNGDIIKSL